MIVIVFPIHLRIEDTRKGKRNYWEEEGGQRKRGCKEITYKLGMYKSIFLSACPQYSITLSACPQYSITLCFLCIRYYK